MGFVEETTGKSWAEDAYTHDQFKQVVLTVLKAMRLKGKSEPPKDWPWDNVEPKGLGKASAFGAMAQVAAVDDRRTDGTGRGAQFFSTNIRHNLGYLVERIDGVIWWSKEEVLVDKSFQTFPNLHFGPRRK